MEIYKEPLPIEKKKHIMALALTMNVMSFADEFANTLGMIVERKAFPKTKPPSNKTWLSFYRSPCRLLLEVITGPLPVATQDTHVLSSFFDTYQKYPHQTLAEMPAWTEEVILPSLTNAFGREYSDAKREAAGKSKEQPPEYWEQFDSHSDVLYFLNKVLLPCLIYYRLCPVELYYKARSGDLASIRRLIKLDNTKMSPISSDIKIRRHIQMLKETDKKGYRKYVGSAMSSGGLKKLSKAKVKAILAAFLQILLNIPDIPSGFKMTPNDYLTVLNIASQMRGNSLRVFDPIYKRGGDVGNKWRVDVSRERKLWNFPDKVKA